MMNVSVTGSYGLKYLQCPVCEEGEGAYIHQKRVWIHFRTIEDGPGWQHVVDGEETQKRALAKDAPEWSGRRDDLVIEFMCESHPERPVYLCVAQHKGVTILSWRDRAPGAAP